MNINVLPVEWTMVNSADVNVLPPNRKHTNGLLTVIIIKKHNNWLHVIIIDEQKIPVQHHTSSVLKLLVW